MKTDVARPLRALWLALSEVPGWPDAPFVVRLRRLWPILVPLAGCVALVVWTRTVREPMRDQVRAAHAELLALEQDADALRQNLSQQTADEINAAAEKARQELLASPSALDDRLAPVIASARTDGWNTTVQTYGLTEEGATEDTPRLAYVPVRVRLEPVAGAPDRFNSLLAQLTRLTELPGHVEMTRLQIRANADGVSGVEVNLRAACRPPADEKAAQ